MIYNLFTIIVGIFLLALCIISVMKNDYPVALFNAAGAGLCVYQLIKSFNEKAR